MTPTIIGPNDETQIACDSIPSKTSTGEVIGWVHGYHFIRSAPPATCPRCGAPLKGIPLDPLVAAVLAQALHGKSAS